MKNFIIAILAVLVLCLGGYIVYDKVINKDDEPKFENNESIEEQATKEEYNDFVEPSSYVTKLNNKTYIVDVDVSKYNNIFEYIQKQNNVTMDVIYCTDEDYDNLDGYSGKYTFNENELNTIFSEMKQSTKTTKSGLGGVCVPKVEITYIRNNVSKYVNFYSIYSIIDTNDGNLYKIYENDLNSIEEDPTYRFENLSETLKNKLIELAGRY